MQINKLKYCLALLGVFLANYLFSQKQQYSFSNIDYNQGLSQNSVNDIIQDDLGFLWIATNDGLNRYDGNSIIVFRKNQESNSLPGNLINCLAKDSQGNIWVGTLGEGICMFDPARMQLKSCDLSQKTFKHESNIIHDIVEFGNKLWVASEHGLHVIDTDGNYLNTYLHIYNKHGSLRTNKTRKLLVLGNALYIGSQDSGMFVFRPKTNRFTQVVPKTKELPQNFTVNDLCLDVIEPENQFWIASDIGILLFDKKNFTYREYDLSALTTRPQNEINCVLPQKSGELWLGVQNKGLFLLNKKQNLRLTCSSDFSIKNQIFPGVNINCIYNDSFNNLWIGSQNRGFYTLSQNQFTNICNYYINDTVSQLGVTNIIMVDSSGINCVGTRNGLLIRTDIERSKCEAQEIFNIHLLENIEINSVARTDKNTLWIGTSTLGLYKYEYGANKLTFIDILSKKGINSDLNIRDISVIDGKLWLASNNNGLWFYNPANNEVQHFPLNSIKMRKGMSVKLNVLRKSKNGKLWIGTSGKGMICFDTKTNNYEEFTSKEYPGFKGKYITSIYEDNNNILWIGTYLEGLYRFEPQKLKFENFTTKESLANNIIYSIVEDRYNNLWLSTNKGISRFNKQNNYLTSFGFYDGIKQDFIAQSCATDCQGNVYFGGNKGITFFEPKAIKKMATFPKINFTELYISNRLIRPGSNSLLKKSLAYTDTLILSKKDKNITVSFAPQNVWFSKNLFYSYKLDGFDNEWLKCKYPNQKLKYTNLPSGTYSLKIKASSSEELWADDFSELVVVIKPVYYETVLFRALIGLILGVLIFIIYKLKFSSKNGESEKDKKLLEIHTTALKLRTEELETEKTDIEKQKEELLRKFEELEQQQVKLEKTIELRTRDLEIAKNKAEQADEIKTAFLSNMSHEIRTPMNGIIGFVNLLAMNNVTDEQRKVYIQHINYSSKTLLQLMEDIIDTAKLEVGDSEFNIQDITVSDTLSDVLKYYEAFLEEHEKSKLELVLQDNFPGLIVQTDDGRLRQILSNLIENAIKFTEEGKVVFGVELKKNEVLFFVKDTGIGIKPEEQKVIFDRFRKLNYGDEQLYRGTGLGLSISKKVVEMLGGKIWVESELDKGSCFYFTLPYNEKINLQKQKAEGDITSAANIENLRVLIVDDEMTNYLFLEAALEKINAYTTWANNGKKAVDFINEGQVFDVILMDIKMPVMDGFKATRLIKQIQPNIPIIAQTAYTMMDEEEKSYEAGCNAYLSKPIDLKKLHKTLENMVKTDSFKGSFSGRIS